MTSPGWFPDPSGLPQSRYWNGAAWTVHTQVPVPIVTVGAPVDWNALAVVSMVLGVLYLGGAGSIAAIVLGHLSIKEIDSSDGREKGRIFSAIGLALGYLGVAVTLFAVAFYVFLSLVI